MRQTLKLFHIGLRQIAKDGMLLVLLPAPFIIGMVFKFALPFVNGMAEARLSFLISPWYGLADGLLIALAPMMTAMICAFLLLEERDEGIAAFYQVTPTGGYSYLAARVGFPMVWAFMQSVAVAALFNLTGLSFAAILEGSAVSTLAGIFLAMLVVSIAGNRVEGLALSKMMGISLLGIVAAWFVPPPYLYLASFLPAFWIQKIVTDGANLMSFGFGLLSSVFWICLFARKFMRRIY